MNARLPAFLHLVGAIAVLSSPAAQAEETAPCDRPANAIQAENCLAGTPRWIWDTEGDRSIEGFATDISADRGDTIAFKVRSDASDWSLEIYRMGWYGGDGARRVAVVHPGVPLPQRQPACVEKRSTGLVDCGGWAVSATWQVPPDAVSGIYFARAVRADTGGSSHIVFVVRDDESRSDILFQTADTTWQAYNTWGGNSLYHGKPAGRAYEVSYNRPFDTRRVEPETWVFNAEYPMVRWLERNGYDVTYHAGVDTDRLGHLIPNHRVWMSNGHDEYWSERQRRHVEAARDAGVHLAFFSGNKVFWRIRWEPSADGADASHRTLVCYKDTLEGQRIDPSGQATGTWRDGRFGVEGEPENALTGTIFEVNGPFLDTITVPAADGKMRFWRDTRIARLAPGEVATLARGTLGAEVDVDRANGFRPPGLIGLSTNHIVSDHLLLQDEGSRYGPGEATHRLTLYRHQPGGALVFSTGTYQWAWGLDDDHDRAELGSGVDRAMQQATVNLLADMGVQPATLQPGLVRATASTDGIAPTTTIASPAGGSLHPANQPLVLTGTAQDEGGAVGAVEVSLDGGGTWMPATGRQHWRFEAEPLGCGTFEARVRAVDDSGNLEVQPATLHFDVGDTAPAGPMEVAATLCQEDEGVAPGRPLRMAEARRELLPESAPTHRAALRDTMGLPTGDRATVHTAMATPASDRSIVLTAVTPSGSDRPTGSPAVATRTAETAPKSPPIDPMQGPGGPILVIGGAAHPLSYYTAEILRAEGFNAFEVVDLHRVDRALLDRFDVAILGALPLEPAQARLLADWVRWGGRLIALRPDTRLAPILGLVPGGDPLDRGYLRIDTRRPPGRGITGETLQYFGGADRYELAGAEEIARLYSSRSRATDAPAVTLHRVGEGMAAAFTFDLALSIVRSRQGNPAWVGKPRGGSGPARSHDLFTTTSFFGLLRDNWVDPERIHIPQADELQRLFANLLVQLGGEVLPLPRFWYLPSFHEAAVVLTGDDHANAGTIRHYQTHLAASPDGCSVDAWECVRSTSYIWVETPLDPRELQHYDELGFETALHVDTGCADWSSPQALDAIYRDGLARFSARYPGLPAPATNRTHCIAWSDFDSQPRVARRHGIRLDTNYYYWPEAWVQNRPGFMTGSATPMRFVDRAGRMVDVYQAATHMTDESGQRYPFTVETLLDRALGPEEHYGVFTANMHTDFHPHPASEAIVRAARERGVPVISARQLLTWLDGRDASFFADLHWAAPTLTFHVHAARGARHLQAMVPLHVGALQVASVQRDGWGLPFRTERIKGVDYAIFEAWTGAHSIAYRLQEQAADRRGDDARGTIGEAR